MDDLENELARIRAQRDALLIEKELHAEFDRAGVTSSPALRRGLAMLLGDRLRVVEDDGKPMVVAVDERGEPRPAITSRYHGTEKVLAEARSTHGEFFSNDAPAPRSNTSADTTDTTSDKPRIRMSHAQIALGEYPDSYGPSDVLSGTITVTDDPAPKTVAKPRTGLPTVTRERAAAGEYPAGMSHEDVLAGRLEVIEG